MDLTNSVSHDKETLLQNRALMRNYIHNGKRPLQRGSRGPHVPVLAASRRLMSRTGPSDVVQLLCGDLADVFFILFYFCSNWKCRIFGGEFTHT